MAISPFAAPIPQERPEQQAAAMAIEQRQAGPEAQMAEGMNPVAAHLVAALKALVQRGAAAGQPLPEDMAAIQQFLDGLMQMQGQGAPPGQGAPEQGPGQPGMGSPGMGSPGMGQPGMVPAGIPQG
jgi:hypothetical protein